MPYKNPEKRRQNNRKLNNEYYDRIRSKKTPRYIRMLKVQSDKEKLKRANFTKEERERDARMSANRRMKRKFGISIEQYEVMLSGQNGVCKICLQPEHKGWRLAIDHCHKTGVIRGLLCSRCNTVIGHMEDSIKLMQSAISYLMAGRVTPGHQAIQR